MLISCAELASHLSDASWVIFDCRHDLMDHTKGPRLYAEGHLPGAHFASVETALAGEKNGRNGRHPLPTPAAFAEDAKAPPQKNAKVAAKSTKAHGAKSKGKTPADTESKSDATKTPSSDKE